MIMVVTPRDGVDVKQDSVKRRGKIVLPRVGGGRGKLGTEIDDVDVESFGASLSEMPLHVCLLGGTWSEEVPFRFQDPENTFQLETETGSGKGGIQGLHLIVDLTWAGTDDRNK